MSDTIRIALLGKTGAGKSSLANTIFGEDVFKTSSSPNSQTSICKAESRSVNGRSITLIDTPGFFDTGMTEEELKKEMVKCVIECAPGPHAFLIVLKVERYTDHEEAVVKKISQYFSEEAFKYTAVVFTHGDQLDEEMKIHDFVNQSKGLRDLVEKCGRRCHVIDSKYWNNNQQDPYRSNQFQVAQLLCTIDKIIKDNNGGYYTNELLQAAEREIGKSGKNGALKRFLIILAGVTAGALLGALLGLGLYCIAATAGLLKPTIMALGISVAVFGGVGAVAGGIAGHYKAKKAETATEANNKAPEASCNQSINQSINHAVFVPRGKFGLELRLLSAE